MIDILLTLLLFAGAWWAGYEHGRLKSEMEKLDESIARISKKVRR